VISFRYHVVSLVAVLLALAAGVALGGGPLSELGRSDEDATASADERNAELADRLDVAGRTDAFQDEFTEVLAPRLVGGSLTNRPVVVVTLPGADEKVVTSIEDLLDDAGASVAGEYAVLPRLLDASEKSLVNTMSSQLIESLKAKSVAASAPTYDRIGGLVGRAIATEKDNGEEVDSPSQDILSSVKGADLFVTEQGGDTRGSLVVVVLGDEHADLGDTAGVVGGFLTGIASQSDGVVVAGSTQSADDGLLGALRDDVTFSANVSSADSADTVAGRVAALMALSTDARGTTGHYGADGIDGAIPRG
jgi:hypothetical protein